MKNNFRNKKAITLIALVITIVALLILAGITVASLTGDNGLIHRTIESKNNAEKSSVKEELEQAVMGSMKSTKGEYDADDVKVKIQALIAESGMPGTAGYNNGTYKGYRYRINTSTYEVIVDDYELTLKVGNTDLKDVADLSTLYGEDTDYISIEGITWQLFYDDTDAIYLIAKDFVPNSTLPSELIKSAHTSYQWKDYCAYFGNMIAYNTYSGTIIDNIPWSNGADSNTITGNAQTNTYLKWVNSSVVTTRNNLNMKAVAYMMDTSKWSNFAGNVPGATAIGGPTIEMFVLSYNAKHGTNQFGTYGTSANDITSTNANDCGYMVSINGGSWSKSVMNPDKTDNMWFKANDFNKASGMWCSSPSSNNNNSIVCAITNCNISYYTVCGFEGCAFRPLVTIPKSSLK